MRNSLAGIPRGARRGAKVGFWTYVIIMMLLCGMAGILATLVPAVRADMPKEFAWETLTVFKILKYVGGVAFFFLGFGTLYGAIPGAMVLGLISSFRWHPPVEEPPSDSAVAVKS